MANEGGSESWRGCLICLNWSGKQTSPVVDFVNSGSLSRVNASNVFLRQTRQMFSLFVLSELSRESRSKRRIWLRCAGRDVFLHDFNVWLGEFDNLRSCCLLPVTSCSVARSSRMTRRIKRTVVSSGHFYFAIHVIILLFEPSVFSESCNHLVLSDRALRHREPLLDITISQI